MPNYLALAFESALSVFGIRSVYEQPPYEVVARLKSAVEVRSYAPRLAAETTVEAPTEEAGRSAAFRILAGYIFGSNRSRQDIAMTSPVATSRPGREIAMTSPVATAAAGGGRHTMRFFLPKAVTAENAPVPNDPRVRIVTVPAQTVAALTFSGLGSRAALDARRSELLSALAGSGWRLDGEPETLFYDPPFTIPFLRRNEVTVRVRPADG